MLNTFCEKMLKTGEMLSMLNVGLENGPFWAHIFPKHLTYLTYLTFYTFLWESPLNTFNIFNISPVLSTFRQKYLTFPPVS